MKDFKVMTTLLVCATNLMMVLLFLPASLSEGSLKMEFMSLCNLLPYPLNHMKDA